MFDNIIKQKDLERDQLQNDIAKFLSSGGEITQLEDWVDKPNKPDEQMAIAGKRGAEANAKLHQGQNKNADIQRQGVAVEATQPEPSTTDHT